MDYGLRRINESDPSRNQRTAAWAAFYADPEWPASMEKYGETVSHITNHILNPLPFSPLP